MLLASASGEVVGCRTGRRWCVSARGDKVEGRAFGIRPTAKRVSSAPLAPTQRACRRPDSCDSPGCKRDRFESYLEYRNE